MMDRGRARIVVARADWKEIRRAGRRPVKTERAGDRGLEFFEFRDVGRAVGEEGSGERSMAHGPRATLERPLEVGRFEHESAERLPPHVMGEFEFARQRRGRIGAGLRRDLPVIGEPGHGPAGPWFGRPGSLRLRDPAPHGVGHVARVEPLRRLGPQPAAFALHPSARLAGRLVIGVIAKRLGEEGDRGGRTLRERLLRGGLCPLRPRGQFRVGPSGLEGEREQTCCAGAPRCHEISPDRLLFGRVDEIGRDECLRNREHTLAARGLGQAPAAHEGGKLCMAASVGPPCEIGGGRRPRLVELVARDQLGSGEVCCRHGGDDRDGRSDDRACRRPRPPPGAAACHDEQIAKRRHAIDRVDKIVPRVVRFEEAKPAGHAGGKQHDAESIAGKDQRRARHGGRRCNAGLTPAERVGIGAAEPERRRIEQHGGARAPPHCGPPCRRIEPWPGKKRSGDEVEEHDQEGNRKRLPKSVEPATDRHARDRHEHDAAQRDWQPARDRPPHHV